MSKYTTELRYIVESGFPLGLDKYPIFDENYRNVLNNKIIEHFYFKEIGFETAELFKRFLNRKMNEIMPLYNQKYKSQLLEFNPLYNVDLTETLERENRGNSQSNSENSGNSISNSNSNTDSKNIGSDTPQGKISLDNIEQANYASTTNWGKSNSNVNDNTNTTSNSKNDATMENLENYTKKVLGNNGGANYSQLLNDFRSTFLNIDMEIIEELEPLFMGLW